MKMAKKRGNGEGSIGFHKKSGLYMARYPVQTPTGTKRKAVYGKTRREVDEKLTKAKMDRDIGLAFDAGNLKVGEYLTRWLPDGVKDTVKQTTYESYERLARVHLVPALGRIKLKNLTPAHVRALYREKRDSGLSATSVQRIHALLHKALKQAVNDDLIPRNVTEAIKAPRQVRKEIQALPPEQARAFLRAAESDRLGALYLLAIHTGLRQGELLGLKWGDVDLDRGTLQVRRTLSAAKGGPTFTTPKSNNGRSVRLTARAAQALRDHRKRQVEEQLKQGGRWQDTGLVFTSTVGTPLNRHYVFGRSFKPLLRRAGLPNVPFHALRHSFATLMLSGREHPKVVQEMLGHSRINTTLDFYSHVLPDMQREAVDRLDVMLS
jgi:integrase